MFGAWGSTTSKENGFRLASGLALGEISPFAPFSALVESAWYSELLSPCGIISCFEKISEAEDSYYRPLEKECLDHDDLYSKNTTMLCYVLFLTATSRQLASSIHF
jgi:hypothetical protein